MIPEAVLERHRGEFRWGTDDCVHFVRDAVEAITGVRVALPEYDSEMGAARLLAGSSLWAEAEKRLEPTASPQVGDIVLSSFLGMGQVVGVADPPVFWLRAQRGVVPVDMCLAVKVLRCPKPSRS